jgi:hypothetical protein
VQPVRVSVQPVHVIPVAHITPVHSPCMPPSSHAQSGNYLYCHPTHPSHRSVLTAWCRSLRPTSVGARHTHPIEVSVAENSSPHRSLPAAVSTKNQHHVCRLSRSCAMDAGRRCPARHWYVCPIALVLQHARHHALQHALQHALRRGLASESSTHRRREPRARTRTVSLCGPAVATPDSPHATVTPATHSSQLHPAACATLHRIQLTVLFSSLQRAPFRASRLSRMSW